jgi:hypothetical protein
MTGMNSIQLTATNRTYQNWSAIKFCIIYFLGNFESSEPDASRSSSNFEIATVQATLDFILDSIDSMGKDTVLL